MTKLSEQEYQALLGKVVDILDIETFIVGDSEEEAKSVMQSLFEQWGFTDTDFVFVEQHGLGAKVRARAYVHRPGDHYGWLK